MAKTEVEERKVKENRCLFFFLCINQLVNIDFNYFFFFVYIALFYSWFCFYTIVLYFIQVLMIFPQGLENWHLLAIGYTFTSINSFDMFSYSRV